MWRSGHPPPPFVLSLSKDGPEYERLDRPAQVWQAGAMAFWTYLLRCGDGKFYAGHTDQLEGRIAQHQAGRGCDFTARRQPVTFAWAQDIPTRLESLAAERQIKGWSRAKKEALIAGDWDRVSQLAASRSSRPSTSSGRTGAMGDGASNPIRVDLIDACAPAPPVAP